MTTKISPSRTAKPASQTPTGLTRSAEDLALVDTLAEQFHRSLGMLPENLIKTIDDDFFRHASPFLLKRAVVPHVSAFHVVQTARWQPGRREKAKKPSERRLPPFSKRT
jgi:hypothetical protein